MLKIRRTYVINIRPRWKTWGSMPDQRILHAGNHPVAGYYLDKFLAEHKPEIAKKSKYKIVRHSPSGSYHRVAGSEKEARAICRDLLEEFLYYILEQ